MYNNFVAILWTCSPQNTTNITFAVLFSCTSDMIFFYYCFVPANTRVGEDVLKTSSRHFFVFQDVFKTSSRHYWKKSSWRRLEDVLKMSSGRFWKTYCKQVLKTFSRHLQDVLEDKKLLRWRRLGKQEMFAGAWFVSSNLMVIIFHGFSNHRYYFRLIVLLEQLSFWKLTAYSHKVAIW